MLKLHCLMGGVGSEKKEGKICEGGFGLGARGGGRRSGWRVLYILRRADRFGAGARVFSARDSFLASYNVGGH